MIMLPKQLFRHSIAFSTEENFFHNALDGFFFAKFFLPTLLDFNSVYFLLLVWRLWFSAQVFTNFIALNFKYSKIRFFLSPKRNFHKGSYPTTNTSSHYLFFSLVIVVCAFLQFFSHVCVGHFLLTFLCHFVSLFLLGSSCCCSLFHHLWLLQITNKKKINQIVDLQFYWGHTFVIFFLPQLTL